MNLSFYSAAVAAMAMQDRLNVTANNIANVNTSGYKTGTSVFSELIYSNMIPGGQGADVPAGAGVTQTSTYIDFSPSMVTPSGQAYDFAIFNEPGFFRLEDPATGEISYTRNGHFSLSLRDDTMYLVTDAGKLVTGEDGNPITVENGVLSSDPAVYVFENTAGMLAAGNGEYIPVEKNGEPVMNNEAEVKRGYIEGSNVDLATEMVRTIEASRAYSYALKMVQTSDEIEQTVNNLRG